MLEKLVGGWWGLPWGGGGTGIEKKERGIEKSKR